MLSNCLDTKKAQNLPAKLRLRIKEAVTCLIRGDVHHLDIKRLSPYPHEHRLRVGKIRILLRADKELLFIFKAGFRGEIYKSLKSDGNRQLTPYLSAPL
jgi:mRNA interferase RelE/StbE